MKLLSTQLHGTIDYIWAAAVPMLPHSRHWGPAATQMLTAAGVGTLAYSLLTRYELGAVRILPMRAHLALDILQGVTLLSAPLWLDEEGEAPTALVGLGLIALAVALTTETEAPEAAARCYEVARPE